MIPQLCIEYKERSFTFGIAPKVTKGLGPKPPKAEKPDGTLFPAKAAGLRGLLAANSTATCSGFRIRHPLVL